MKKVQEKAKETQLFLRRMVTNFNQIGALLPTSTGTARALASEANRHVGPKRVLEVGPGTGPISAQLARHLRPGDKLVLCELDPHFADHLRKRFETEPLLARVKDQVEIICGSVTDMPGEAEFDYLISSVPFTRLPAEMVEEIFATYRRLLKPGGAFTYLEYSFLRALRRVNPLDKSPRMTRIEEIITEQLTRYQYRFERVYWNVPPATVRSLRFSDPAPEAALSVKARWRPSRWHLPGTGIAKEVWDFVLGLGGLAWFLRSSGSRWWPVPLAGSLFGAWFHRDPDRHVSADLEAAYSACDGVVMKVDNIRHPRLGDQEWIRIASFLSPLDVHMNRAPIAGRLADTWEEPGGFLPAFRDDSELNSSRYIVLEGPHGRCAIAQRAGFVARRIITWTGRNELLAQGEVYGMIRLGSRTDVLLPADKVDVCVKAGDRVVAGTTVVARWRS